MAEIRSSSDFSPAITSSPILVTGATGFIAGHIILQLLMRGYRVRGTVRDLSKPESFAYLSRLQNAAENLELVEANLLNPHDHKSWQDAFSGVEYVMHVASPNTLLFEDGQNEIIDPAVLGTQTILRLCHQSDSIKKVIVTSCMCAITDQYEPGRKYSEQDWNETASSSSNVYSYSKVMAEREAVTSASQEGTRFSLVTLLPGTVLGPHLGGRISFSHRFLLNFLQERSGRGFYSRVSVSISRRRLKSKLRHLRYVARFHIAAMEQHLATGRYICANSAISLQKILQIIHENFSDMNVSKRPVPDVLARVGIRTLRPEVREFILQRLGKPPYFSKSRMKQLNVPLRTPAETVVDTCRFFIDSNIVSFMDETHASCALL